MTFERRVLRSDFRDHVLRLASEVTLLVAEDDSELLHCFKNLTAAPYLGMCEEATIPALQESLLVTALGNSVHWQAFSVAVPFAAEIFKMTCNWFSDFEDGCPETFVLSLAEVDEKSLFYEDRRIRSSLPLADYREGYYQRPSSLDRLLKVRYNY